MSTKAKYILHPGYVMGDGRGNRGKRWVGSNELARLYNVPKEHCFTPERGMGFDSRYYGNGQVHLHPRESGNYPDLSKAPLDD